MPNRLTDATSPYLLQHKDNPVDWWEWGPEPFEEARRRDVPVLLSVGYAACHWCHVMAHESFEDPLTAGDMNRMFVNVKVDREERPDVDSIYMEAVQAMTGHGGWPMTVWIDHEGRAFFAGTYYPNEPRHGMPSFRQVMEAVSHAWADRRSDVEDQAVRLLDAITGDLPPPGRPASDALRPAYDRLRDAYDSENGGFGHAPKFPQQPVLEFLLRIHAEPWAKDAKSMLLHTLERLETGGIHDQIGGGFARYATDEKWLVPHFEKMLYDNAQLARMYLWAGVEFGRQDLLETARSTLEYLVRDLRHPEGGFLSSEDADSEGVEGKFYVWSVDEIRQVLGNGAEAVIEYYGVTSEGNFEGRNILSIVGPTRPETLPDLRTLLLEHRSRRIRPGLDDKVIASWNGLAIRAFAEAAAVFGDDRFLSFAGDAAAFVLANLMVDGRLKRSWREGKTSVPAFLEDHASVAVGFFALYAASGDMRWYEQAMSLVAELDRFIAPDGGFYATSADGEPLVKRPRDFTDNPLPSGSALAAEALFMAGLYTGRHELGERAAAAINSVGTLLERYPSMVGHHLAVRHSMQDSRELAIVGAQWPTLARVFWARFRPDLVLAVSSGPEPRVPLLVDRFAEGLTRAFVCRGHVCDLPVSEPEELARLLS